jgi:arginyl-tRNA synthetase
LKQRISDFIAKRLSLESAFVAKPKDAAFGHFCTPAAFALSKGTGKTPNLIALDLCAKLQDSEMFESVTADGGYVNFTLSLRFLDHFATKALYDNDRFGSESGGESVLLEFVSANPTGPLHIGHARGAVFGDALARLGRHLGHRVASEYYINDAGNQIELLGRSVYFKAKTELLGEKIAFPEECYQGDYVSDLAKEAFDMFGRAAFASEETIENLSGWAKNKMLDWIKTTLSEADIKFDNFVSERALYIGWDRVRSILEKNDALYVDAERKEYLASSRKGDSKDRVVVRENGIPTYLAGDIIYHHNKFERRFDRYINIWGADHHGYIARVKAAIEFLGYDSGRLEVLLSQMVALLKGGEPYKMSKRSGNFVPMEEVGREIGYDALKFVFLTKRADTHLEFDLDLLAKEDSSNPVYYVNYAHARICSLFEKLGRSPDIDTPLVDLSGGAKELLFYALLLPEVITEAFNSRQPHLVTDYLYKLSGRLHRFYADNRVIGSANEEQILKVFAVVRLAIWQGLRLLGIKAKTKM